MKWVVNVFSVLISGVVICVFNVGTHRSDGSASNDLARLPDEHFVMGGLCRIDC